MSTIDKMIRYCEVDGFTERKVAIIMQEIDNSEMLLKDILQYFHYFIRPDFRQKPDVDIATDRYKQIADSRTGEELRALVGKSHKIDFESLGSEHIEIESNKVEYNPILDGDLDEYTDEEDDLEIEPEDEESDR